MAYDVVSDLLKAFREDEKDAVAPYFWSDAQLLRFTNEALTAFAELTKSVYDDSSAITQIDLGAGEQELAYAEQILDVLEASTLIDGREQALEVVAPGVVPRTQQPTSGKPRLLIVNTNTNVMRLLPAPQGAGLLRLGVVRTPLRELGKDDRLADVPTQQRPHLLLYIKHKAYAVADAEVFDAARVARFKAEFEAECQRIYEDNLRRRSVRRPIRFRW
jgi:hypothetical protein